MAEVLIYTTRICPYCVAAKRLFDKKGVPYREIDVTRDFGRRGWLVKTTGQRTVPQIFIGGRPCGGYVEIATLERSGELDRVLSGPDEAL